MRQAGARLDGDFITEGMRLLAQMVMDLEVTQRIGAGRHERTAERTNQRNGYRDRLWDTRVGTIELQIPKLRHGSYFPSLLEPRRRTEKALLAVIQQAYIGGVSTRKVDDLVQALGLNGLDKSAVSRTCKELDELVEQFRNRPLEASYPYVWLDAIYLKVRQNHRIVSLAAVTPALRACASLAIGVRETGERDVLGVAIGAGESEPFWTEFLRNLLSYVPQGDKSLVAALVRTVFAQPSRQAADQQLLEVTRVLESRWPKAATVLVQAADDVVAYMAFPKEHWTRIYSTNPLERLNREIRRRTDVVGIFPDEDSAIRLVGAILMERADEWEVERRPFSLESMRKLTAPDLQALSQAEPEPLRLAPTRRHRTTGLLPP